MKRFWVVLVALVCVCAFSLDDASAAKRKFSPVARLSHSGDISGVIACADAVGPDSEALIYIPGRSFMVKTQILTETTDTDTSRVGTFRFYSVPTGTYDLVIEIPGQDPITVPDVVVNAKELTNLGDIPVTCPAATPAGN